MKYYKNTLIQDIEGEIWKDVSEFPSYYQVSNYGRVKSYNRTVSNLLTKGVSVLKGKVLVQTCSKSHGYLLVCLCINQVRYSRSVHRLVAKEFHKQVELKNMVNHIDADKTNNISSNLEWCTAKENCQHAISLGLKPKPNNHKGYNNPLSKEIFCLNFNGELVKRYGSSSRTKLDGFQPRLVRKVIQGKRPQHKGYLWTDKLPIV